MSVCHLSVGSNWWRERRGTQQLTHREPPTGWAIFKTNSKLFVPTHQLQRAALRQEPTQRRRCLDPYSRLSRGRGLTAISMSTTHMISTSCQVPISPAVTSRYDHDTTTDTARHQPDTNRAENGRGRDVTGRVV